MRVDWRPLGPIPEPSSLTSLLLPSFLQADTEAAAAPVVEERKPHLPNPREGEHVFGVAHIFASFNDTFVVRITLDARLDGHRLAGAWTLFRKTLNADPD